MDLPIAIEDVDGGRACIVDLRVQPGARRAGLAGVWNARLKIAVSEPAEDGRANGAVLRALAEELRLPARSVTLVSGERSRLKRVRIALSAHEVRVRLAEHLA